MPDSFGLSFSPGQDTPNGQKPTPVQQAIQTLSLRIPSRAGASAFTPQGLLPSPTESAGTVGGAPDLLLEAIKRLLFGGGTAAPSTQNFPGGSATFNEKIPTAPGAPRVNPGYTNPTTPPTPLPEPPTLPGPAEPGIIKTPTPQPMETSLPAATFPSRPPRPDNRV